LEQAQGRLQPAPAGLSARLSTAGRYFCLVIDEADEPDPDARIPTHRNCGSSKEFLTLSQNAQRNYSVVIYDTPAALESADAYVVASRVGAAILAARRHRTKAKDISKISRALEGFQCDIAGSILSRF
jgi:hypothetical protein